MKYRTKSFEVEAMRYDAKKPWLALDFVGGPDAGMLDDDGFALRTPAGDMEVFDGDWITHKRGEEDCESWSPGEFEARYEPA